MGTENRGLDLERELTCSICTEVLYQPLTLLDCLHAFCGSCLKEWFSFQLASYRNAPNSHSLAPGATPYTCPSCRAPVRDTKPNATVTTLLEMLLAAHPDKARTDEDKEEIKKKYTPGETVLPKVEEKEKSLRERRVEDADRRLMNEVRELSLREVGVETPEARRERRRRENALRAPRSRDASRDASRDGRHTEEREREARRRREEHQARHGREESSEHRSEEERRRLRHEERSRNEDSTHTAVRQIEHQSSLRSLISSSDVDSREMEEEILRQIREEGLLDGIDLENIDVSQEDQISERIAEAFRRRQSERSRQEPERRSNASRRRRTAPNSAPQSRETSGDEAVRASSRRQRAHSRTPSTNSQMAEPSRPPQSISAIQAAHLEVQSAENGRRRRRRASSSARSATDPIPVVQPETRSAARSQTDLSDRSSSVHLSESRPAASVVSRSITDPSVPQATDAAINQRSRQPRSSPNSSPRSSSTAQMEDLPARERRTRAAPPADIHAAPATPNLIPAPLSPHDPSRTMSLSERANALASGSRPSSSSSVASRNRLQLYNEPFLNCARCSKPHIEYELHYNCSICAGGNYNICLSCYRSGAGCLHWFGFGQAAWTKWEIKNQLSDGKLEKPHMLTPSRYIQPKITAGGADGRKTLTTDDPQKRLQSGTFCDNCFAWTNECYWRCDLCNEGDWGFCNLCVNQGKSCTHPLLPLTYKPPENNGPPISPTHDQQTPATASILTGPGIMDIGPFKPLTFSTKCDICRYPIQPSQTRYHCFSCTSKVPNTLPGDYDVCTTCYPKLVASRRISPDNGPSGWRRCLQGHRMVVVGFEDSRGGQRRVLVHDLVGGQGISEKPSTLPEHAGQNLQLWSWGDGVHADGDNSHRKLVTTDIMKSPPPTATGLVLEKSFPPDGGVGMVAMATWSWYPIEGADDELLFPKGAEVRECKDVNGDWFHGSYMGKTGLFPSNYVRVLDRSAGT